MPRTAPSAQRRRRLAGQAPEVLVVAVYLRMSRDAIKRRLGVEERQKPDCLELVRRQWPAAEVRFYEDNDVRASRREDGSLPERPAYKRMVADMRAGVVHAVVAWDMDRLVRDDLEREEFFLAAKLAGLHRLAFPGLDVNVETEDGMTEARILGMFAARETKKMGRRLKRKHLELAERGLWASGPRPFGYRLRRLEDGSGTTLELEPHEAAIVREWARRILAGESMRSLLADAGARGIKGPRGQAITGATLRGILLSGRVAGLREHKGEVVGPADWPAILERETWDKLALVLNRPSRAPGSRPGRLKWVLSHYAVCGAPPREPGAGRVVTLEDGSELEVCGHRLGIITRKGAHPAYQCRGEPQTRPCFKTYVRAEWADAMAAELVAQAVDSDALRARLREEDGMAPELLAELGTVERRLEELGREFGRGELPRAVLVAAVAEAEDRKKALALEVGRVRELTTLGEWIGRGGALRETWPHLGADRQRAILEAILGAELIVILPAAVAGGDLAPTRFRVTGFRA